MSVQAECIFCRIIAGEIPSFRIYEDEDVLSFMDINPANEGHALVIPKEHSADLYSISEGALRATVIAARKVARGLRKTIDPSGMNLVQCNGPAAAQSVLHFHMHVLPRLDGDELKLNWGLVPGDPPSIGVLAKRIAANI